MEYTVSDVVIDKIYRNDKNRDGQPYTNKKGQTFEKVDIYINAQAIDDNEFEGKMTYFDYFNTTKNWAPGDSISGSISKNGKYFNFSLPAKGGEGTINSSELSDIKDRIVKLEEKVFSKVLDYSKIEPSIDEALDFSKEVDKKEDDIELDDLPF